MARYLSYGRAALESEKWDYLLDVLSENLDVVVKKHSLYPGLDCLPRHLTSNMKDRDLNYEEQI
jgi:hypothetical protein